MRTAMVVAGILLILASRCWIDRQIRSVMFRAEPLYIMAVWNHGGGLRGVYVYWFRIDGPASDGKTLWTTDGIRNATGLW